MSEAKLFKKINNSYIEITKDQLLIELQEANKSLDKKIERLNKRIKELEEGFKASTEDLCEESAKIDKAIEYIMTELISEWDIKNDGYVSGSDLPAEAITPILDILKGVDKE